MNLRTYITTKDIGKLSNLKLDDTEILTTLGETEDNVAIQVQELFESVSNAVKPIIEAESQLTVEITGQVSVKAQGGIKYLFFNIGGEVGSVGAMKVLLSTKLQPK